MQYINFNGKLFEYNEPIIQAQNRGLRYGDGLFETIKLYNNKLILVDEHFERLWLGMNLLKFEVPILFTKQKLQNEILQLAIKNNLKHARIRVTIVRGNGGIYDAVNNTSNYIIESIPLPQSNGEFNINGMQLCVYNNAKKSIDSFSNLKTNNYLPYFMGALFAKENKYNDAIILNSENNICDSTIANVFYIKDNVFYTTALTQGCVAGVMRAWVILKIKALGYTLHETIITSENLLTADEVFLTNSIYNIRWVASICDSNFSNKIISKLVTTLKLQEKDVFV